MDTTRAEQIVLDDALVDPANRLKIGKSNFHLQRAEQIISCPRRTLQVVYDVLMMENVEEFLTPSTGIPDLRSMFLKSIHAKRFWANAISTDVNVTRSGHSSTLGGSDVAELPFEEAILTFLRDLGHSGEIKMITDVNVNKLHQPWRSFATGMYHKKNVDYAYLPWEDFVYQVENKNVKKSNEMYYPRFTKVIINFFMTKDQSIPRWNSVNWHYGRDDYMFTTIKVVSRHEDTQLYGAILPNELTNEDIRNSKSYKEYYAIASGAVPPKKSKCQEDAS
ncbi:hypothetical protein Tco_1351126 [Tanacetum coccineum]